MFGIVVGGMILMLGRRILPLPGTSAKGLKNRASSPNTDERKPRRWSRVLFILITMVWCLVCSLGAFFLLFLWFFTDHEAGYRNENLFQFNPISFLVLITAIYGFRWRWSRALVLVVLGFSILNVLLNFLPWFPQWNWEVIALALPIHAGLAIAVVMLHNARAKEQS